METFDKATIAAVVAFVENSAAATKKKVISQLLKDPYMRRVARATLDSHERAEKQTSAPKAPEGTESKPQREQRAAEPYIDPERTKNWLRRR
jgi:hypothetical protein